MPALLSPPYRIVDRDPAWVGPWLHQRGGGHWRSGSTCIGLARHGELVAATMYDYFNGASIFAHIAIAGPIIRRWLWFIFYYPFVQLNAKTIVVMIPEDNRKSRALVEHLGFTEQIGLADADTSGDLVLYLLHRDQCRFIRSPYGK